MKDWGGGPRVAKIRAQLIAMYGTICWRCRQPIRGKVTVGHVIARAQGGSDDLSNLRPECERCNYAAGARLGNAMRARRPARPSRAW